MKKLLVLMLMFSISVEIWALPEYREGMHTYLQQHKKLSYRFDSLSLGRSLALLADFSGIEYTVDPSINLDRTTRMIYKDVTPLYLLQEIMRKFNLKYQVVGKNKIHIIPNVPNAISTTIKTTNQVPQLWSSHKLLDISIEQCAKKGYQALQDLGFSQIVQSQYYIYGNYLNNCAAVKCVVLNEQSFVYTAAAGEDVKQVEKLRNEIMKKL